jgi:hypothetical protein|nr:MAG TPA: hypothetical protein [Caudoviricetes sp.]
MSFDLTDMLFGKEEKDKEFDETLKDIRRRNLSLFRYEPGEISTSAEPANTEVSEYVDTNVEMTLNQDKND